MCGIFSYISDTAISDNLHSKLVTEALKSKHRGPDNTKYRLENEKIFLAFHRLSINDISEKGDQPLTHPNDYNIILICNGEIYNHAILKEKYSFITNSKSDCEIILHLYTKFGFEDSIKMLDGVFSCILLDLRDNKEIIYAARDPIGVRPMYIGKNFSNKSFGFASELKNIHNIFESVDQFKPGHIWDSISNQYTCYYNKEIIYNDSQFNYSIEEIKTNIRNLFTEAVKKRTMSDRDIGCLLSGGLDSSLVAALLTKFYNKKLQTFSIGLKGSPDLKYAKIVADHIGSNHHEIIVSETEMLNAIKDVIYQIESYDTTTIRASTPMYLLSKYIKNNTNIAVIYSGEGSDEASGSYLYFHNAPDNLSFKKETNRLMTDLCYFDVLRCDKSTAGAGLEVRVPFLDLKFLKYYMNIDPEFKVPSYGNIEKYLLRKAFSEIDNLLPDKILWRTKEGMSDGVSSQERGWYEIIQEYTDKLYSNEDFYKLQQKYINNPPMSKEALFFRESFNEFYANCDHLIPYYWLPKWSGNIIEPSARILTDIYYKHNDDIIQNNIQKA